MKTDELKIVIENPAGSYKSFETEDDATWNSYPLKGVTYPVDYGFIKDFTGEDGLGLDVFVGTGDLSGFFTIWRLDVPTETKMFLNLTQTEFDDVQVVFAPVIEEVEILDEDSFQKKLLTFKQ